MPLREIPVGPSRHVVRFLADDVGLLALKELPPRIARHEYRLLRAMEAAGLPAVEAVGVVEPPAAEAVLVTRYLKAGFQFRRALTRLAAAESTHRARLFDAMAGLLVELHAGGVYWGDCSLANTLFRRDGQRLEAVLVDAETAELHPSLSDGQRHADIGILVENVAGDLTDLALGLGREFDVERALDEAEGIAARYEALWHELMHSQPISAGDRHAVEKRIRRVNELGFSVDEVRLEPAAGGNDLRLRLAIAGRRFHAHRLDDLTGLEVGEGQAAILLNDLFAYAAAIGLPPRSAARRWEMEIFEPAAVRAHAALGDDTDGVQAYCDLLEVRWLLSESAGYDVGDDVAIEALRERHAPSGSAAALVEAEKPPVAGEELAEDAEELGLELFADVPELDEDGAA